MNGSTAALGAILAVFMFIYYMAVFGAAMASLAFSLLGLWKTFVKLGLPGWKGIIPFYNIYILSDMVNFPNFWQMVGFMAGGYTALMLSVVFVEVPLLLVLCYLAGLAALVVFAVHSVKLYIRVAKAFGLPAGFGVGLSFISPVFLMILGFGKAEYQGPVVD